MSSGLHNSERVLQLRGHHFPDPYLIFDLASGAFEFDDASWLNDFARSIVCS